MVILFLTYLATILGIQGYLWASGRCALQSFPSIAVIIYLAIVVPKMTLYSFVGQDAFITADALSPEEVQIAALLIFLFIVCLQIPYAFGANLGRRRDAEQRKAQIAPYVISFGIHRVKYLSYVLFLPASFLFIGYFASHKGFTFEELFSKGEFVSDGGYTNLYFLQKLGFFVKIPFYAVLMKLLTNGDFNGSSDRVVLALSTFFSISLFLLSGQRSGVFLTIVELLLVLGALGRINFRILSVTFVAFALVNVAVLSARFAGVDGASLAQMFLRRYFFDLEKIALIFRFFSDGQGVFGYSLNAPWSKSPHTEITENIHFFLGQNVFFTNAGVPPSFLGEVLIYFGAAFVIPASLLVSFITKRAELVIASNRRPLVTMLLIVIVSHWIYFALNSDTASFVMRTGLDASILLCAYLFFKVSIGKQTVRIHP